jgi:hypothetical protein
VVGVVVGMVATVAVVHCFSHALAVRTRGETFFSAGEVVKKQWRGAKLYSRRWAGTKREEGGGERKGGKERWVPFMGHVLGMLLSVISNPMNMDNFFRMRINLYSMLWGLSVRLDGGQTWGDAARGK